MEQGKLENKQLNKFLSKIKNNKDVIVNPMVGEDCAVVNMQKENLIITSDPITSVVNNISKLAIDVNLNDLYSAGATPLGVMVTVLFPKNITNKEIEEVFEQLLFKAEKENLNLLGGHTEITDAVVRTVISITAVGKTYNKNFLNYDFVEDDKIIVTKGFGIEGTVILGDYDLKKISENKISNKYLENLALELQQDKKFIQKFLDLDNKLNEEDITNLLLQYKEEISIKKEVEIAKKYNTKIHDVTEGGVLGALFEILEGKDKGCNINLSYFDVNPITLRICSIYNINPFKLISSGSAIIIVKNQDFENICKDFHKNNINYFYLGNITKNNKVCNIDGLEFILTNNEKDELYKCF